MTASIRSTSRSTGGGSLTLLASVLFVSLCYVVSGLIEELLYRYTSHISIGQARFTATSLLLFFLCLVNVLVAVVGMLVFRRSWRIPSTLQCITVGFSYVGAMYFAAESLQYLSYPTQVLVKSCKIINVMWIGFLNRYPNPNLSSFYEISLQSLYLRSLQSLYLRICLGLI